MTPEQKDAKLTQIVTQIGLRDLMIEKALAEKAALFRQYHEIQNAPAVAQEKTDGEG